MDNVFKIRDKKDGLYSSGGYDPGWSDSGKSWSSRKDVEAHLKVYRRGQYPGESKRVPKSWEIVEFRLVEVGSGAAKEK